MLRIAISERKCTIRYSLTYRRCDGPPEETSNFAWRIVMALGIGNVMPLHDSEARPALIPRLVGGSEHWQGSTWKAGPSPSPFRCS